MSIGRPTDGSQSEMASGPSRAVLKRLLERDGVLLLLQLLDVEAGHLRERLEVLEFAFVLAVLHDRGGVLRWKLQDLRDLIGRDRKSVV